MEPINVLFTMPFEKPLIEKIKAVSPQIRVIQHRVEEEADLPEDLEHIDVMYGSGALPQPHKVPRLRWVQLHSAGVNHIVEHSLFQTTEIAFTNASGVHAINIAEYVLAQILAFAHHLPSMFEDKHTKIWTDQRWNRYVCREVYGSTLGIVGYGAIGRQLARIASGLGMEILAVKRDMRTLSDRTFAVPGTGDPDGEIPRRFYPVEALDSFLGLCDYVAILAPLTAKTHRLFDTQAFEAMKTTAILINVARGGLVDEAALIAALQDGRIAGAALDVFEDEPLAENNPLWTLDNVIISPHIAGLTPHYDARCIELFAENLRRFISREPLINLVSREFGY